MTHTIDPSSQEITDEASMDDGVDILLVEDDADTCANMCDILSLDGHRVAVASSAREARQLVSGENPSVIILDRKLPDGTAEHLLPEFRNLLPETDVIVVTGFADLDGTIAALRHGAADYIIKPVNPDALRASLTRILERRRIQRELHKEQQLADRILQTAEAVVLVLDLDGRVVHVNPYFSRITGWTLGEIRAQDWFVTCLPERDRDGAADAFSRAAAGEETTGTIHHIVTRDGRERQIRWSHASLRDEQQNPTAVLAVGVDVTDLIEAQQRALQSERLAAIGQTMTALAHESRGSLQRIQAGLDFLGLELEGNVAAQRDILSIQQAADNLRALLEEVRSYAAPIKLERTQVQMCDVWRWAWQHLEPARCGREATLVEASGDVDPTLFVDVARWEQVFRNLFENSLAACDDPVRIEVGISEAAYCSGIQIVVRDNGPGLTAEQQAKIFDPFFTTKPGGTGLGMAIVQRIVEAHDGTIRIGENESAGAAFVLTLPRTS